ncbi:hypothetical protein BJV77DRAFT_712967 [Russula vinacea]|nr:hypothetical protein BJV77DRAFT_712967 [Russula vinacea]
MVSAGEIAPPCSTHISPDYYDHAHCTRFDVLCTDKAFKLQVSMAIDGNTSIRHSQLGRKPNAAHISNVKGQTVTVAGTKRCLQVTTPDTLQHNGVASLLSRWLLGCVRAMLGGAERVLSAHAL